MQLSMAHDAMRHATSASRISGSRPGASLSFLAMPTLAGAVRARLKLRAAWPAPWKLALAAGFVTQLLLILFVTAIGLKQLAVSTSSLDTIVDVHMRKQDHTREMVAAAHERMLAMFMLTKIQEPFARDELFMEFHATASAFVAARQALQHLPLNDRERELMRLQQRLIAISQPIHAEIVELTNAGRFADAESLLVRKGIPAQNKVMAVLSELDAETRRDAQAASGKAHEVHRTARLFMYLLSGAALVVGLGVAAAVFHYTHQASREHEHLAIHDALTGLPNRTLFVGRLEQSLRRARRRRTLVGVMFLDLDRFKRVNDTLGHACGDQLICQAAERLRAAARAEDIVARWSGDEFVVAIADAASVGDILRVVEKMHAAMGPPYRIDGHELSCSCSIGVSIYPDDGADAGDLMKRADTAMYHAKAAGRNGFQLYDATMNAMATARLRRETDARLALLREEFVLHYRPQVDLESGRVHAVEALMHWAHPEKGLLDAADCLDLLADTGAVIPVGRKLLATACHEAASWHAAGFPGRRLVVNLSDREFWHASLLDDVHAILRESKLPPASLQFELAQDTLMKNTELALARVRALKAEGIAIAIGGFGASNASLAHLKHFPFDALKIDRLFVANLETSPIDRGLVRSITVLCRELHLDAAAEGVETREQLDCLRTLGCTIVQGDFLSPSVPAARLPSLLSRAWPQTRDPA